jgi:hypothetical protein
MKNLPDDIKFLNQLYKIKGFSEKFEPFYDFDSRIDSKISEAENTPLYSALSEWSLVVPEHASPIFIWGWYLGLLQSLANWDILKREALISILERGIRNYETGNRNRVYLDFTEFFREGETGKIKSRSPYNFAEVLEFLIQFYGRDTVFGNLVPSTAKFLMDQETYYRLKRRKQHRVRRPQRKRGYNDKGSLPDDFRITPPIEPEKEFQIFKRIFIKEIKEFLFYPEEFLWFSNKPNP